MVSTTIKCDDKFIHDIDSNLYHLHGNFEPIKVGRAVDFEKFYEGECCTHISHILGITTSLHLNRPDGSTYILQAGLKNLFHYNDRYTHVDHDGHPNFYLDDYDTSILVRSIGLEKNRMAFDRDDIAEKAIGHDREAHTYCIPHFSRNADDVFLSQLEIFAIISWLDNFQARPGKQVSFRSLLEITNGYQSALTCTNPDCNAKLPIIARYCMFCSKATH